MYMYIHICIFSVPLENPKQYNTERCFLRRWAPSTHSSASWFLQCAKTSQAPPHVLSTIFHHFYLSRQGVKIPPEGKRGPGSCEVLWIPLFLE